MDFLKTSARRKSLLSEVVYLGLNVALAILLLVIVVSTATPYAAIGLVLLSKWRIFAVRPRYWFAHLQSNAVDVIVGVSIVLLMYSAGTDAAGGGFSTQVFLTAVYALWLLYLKPMSSQKAMSMQAGVAVLVSTMAVSSISYEWWSTAFVVFMWVVGYSSAKHVLSAYKDEDSQLLSLFWGFVFAQMGWVFYHLLIAYDLPFVTLKLPEFSVILLIISFLAERVYSSYNKHENKIVIQEIIVPFVFSVVLMLFMLVFRSSISVGSV